MRALPVILVAVMALSGCALSKSRISVNSARPAPTVATCIQEQWNRQYPHVRIVGVMHALHVRAGVSGQTLAQAEVYPTVFGSWVSVSTYHREMVVRSHPLIRAALACAE
jgi:hypothetical protein